MRVRVADELSSGDTLTNLQLKISTEKRLHVARLLYGHLTCAAPDEATTGGRADQARVSRHGSVLCQEAGGGHAGPTNRRPEKQCT